MKTPDEIKKGLECARAKVDGRCDAYVACVCCPYFSEAQYPEDIIAYIQQLERERDAAVEQLKEVDRLELFCCSHCKHEELDDFSCTTCIHMSNWEWIGAQEVK